MVRLNTCPPAAPSLLTPLPFIFSTSFIILRRESLTRVMARPPRPARAVRPTLCTYMLRLRGISALITVRTPGMSRPLAATSVATRMSTCSLRNRSRARYRCACDTSPCSSAALTLSSVSSAQNLWAVLFISKNTMVRLPKERQTSASIMASTTSWSTPSVLPEGARTLTNSCTSLGAKLIPPEPSSPSAQFSPVMRTRTGLFRLILTRFSTVLVMVAEKSMVCLATGQ
mmetsp:Transcript_21014/g.46681  ORF Transcript_21014/g.46681 Transcript_21014/m.46681 type:complete len:229 (-) Transcript_21014:1174-1860(-)